MISYRNHSNVRMFCSYLSLYYVFHHIEESLSYLQSHYSFKVVLLQHAFSFRLQPWQIKHFHHTVFCSLIIIQSVSSFNILKQLHFNIRRFQFDSSAFPAKYFVDTDSFTFQLSAFLFLHLHLCSRSEAILGILNRYTHTVPSFTISDESGRTRNTYES